jgi:hypothetical protein
MRDLRPNPQNRCDLKRSWTKQKSNGTSITRSSLEAARCRVIGEGEIWRVGMVELYGKEKIIEVNAVGEMNSGCIGESDFDNF